MKLTSIFDKLKYIANFNSWKFAIYFHKNDKKEKIFVMDGY